MFNSSCLFPGKSFEDIRQRKEQRERKDTRTQREIEKKKRSDDDRWRLVSRSFLRVRVRVVVVVVVFNVVCDTPYGFIFWKRPRRDGVEDAGDDEPVGERE